MDRQVWTNDNPIKGRRANDILFLKPGAVESMPAPEYKPHIIFAVPSGYESIGLTFHFQGLQNESIPYPHSKTSTGFSDRVLPPMYVLLNFGGITDFDDAIKWRTQEPSYHEPPVPGYCLLAPDRPYMPVLWSPSLTKPSTVELRFMNAVFAAPAELQAAAGRLPARPDR